MNLIKLNFSASGGPPLVASNGLWTVAEKQKVKCQVYWKIYPLHGLLG